MQTTNKRIYTTNSETYNDIEYTYRKQSSLSAFSCIWLFEFYVVLTKRFFLNIFTFLNPFYFVTCCVTQFTKSVTKYVYCSLAHKLTHKTKIMHVKPFYIVLTHLKHQHRNNVPFCSYIETYIHKILSYFKFVTKSIMLQFCFHFITKIFMLFSCPPSATSLYKYYTQSVRYLHF